MEKDLEKRIGGFNSEIKKLFEKYSLAIVASPFIMQNGRLGARADLVDIKETKKEASDLEKG